MRAPTEEDYDYVFGKCEPNDELRSLWCEAHDYRWRNSPKCEARLDFEYRVELLLERLEQR